MSFWYIQKGRGRGEGGRESEKKEAVPISFCVCFSKVARAATMRRIDFEARQKTNMPDPRT